MLLKRRYKKEKENYNCLDYNDMLEKFYTDLTAIDSLETIPDKLKRVIKLKKIYIDDLTRGRAPDVQNFIRRLNFL